jgi:ribosomal protein S18 acetylase RimI-like enzyme
MILRKRLGSLLRQSQSFRLYRRLAICFHPKFNIREASPADMAMIKTHFNSGSSSPMPELSPDVTNFIACRKAKIIGFVQLVRHDPGAFPDHGHWLFTLHVWALYRGLGIGEALSRKVMEQARLENARELSLLVYEDNRAAFCMYEKLGFTRVIAPELEKMLEEEKNSSGRRRIVLRRQLP